MKIVRGNKYVRTTDPVTSHRAARVTKEIGRQLCIEIMLRIGRPCTRGEIRDVAMSDGCPVSVADSIRRRASDLVDDGTLSVLSSDGSQQVIWFAEVKSDSRKVTLVRG